jgi:hypothetical protein
MGADEEFIVMVIYKNLQTLLFSESSYFLHSIHVSKVYLVGGDFQNLICRVLQLDHQSAYIF